MGSSQYDELFLSNTMAFKYYQISNSCSFMKESTTELFYKKIKSSNTKICLPIHTSLLNGLFCRNGYMDYLFFEKKVFTYKKKKKTKMNTVVSQQYLGNWSRMDNNEADRKMSIVPASQPTRA